MEDKPPIFKNWNQMYVFVLCMHLFVIILFTIITRYYA